MKAMVTKFLALAAVVLMGTGCASLGTQPVTSLAQRHCDARYDLASAGGLRIGAEKPMSMPIGESSSCLMSSQGVASVYAPVRLPAFSQPYRVTVTSQTAGQALFAPEVQMLDAKGKLLRTIPYDRFSTRGSVLQATVFMNDENVDEKYLVIASAGSQVGQTDSRIVSGMMVIPVIAGAVPMFGVQGTETTQTRTLSYNGIVLLQAEADGPAKVRRSTPHDVAREDFCCSM